MGWNRITIRTVTSAEDMISYELTELGAAGVEVEDHVPLSKEEIDEIFSPTSSTVASAPCDPKGLYLQEVVYDR